MVAAEQIPETLRQQAAERLVSVPAKTRRSAARRLIQTAPEHGIDLDLMWGVIDRSSSAPRVRQVCLLVPTAGRTGMLYLSGPVDGEVEQPLALDERVATLRAAFETVDRTMASELVLLQALLGRLEAWARQACEAAGMTRIGELAYLKLSVQKPALDAEPLPASIRVRPVGDIDAVPDRSALARALELSYIDTQDCPGLCDLRQVDDVIESHRATGAYDPALWWLIEEDDEPRGAVLLSRYPDQPVMELVYLGLAPSLRGRGVGRALMHRAILAAADAGVTEMTCAVDMQNAQALRLYEHLGFRAFDVRLAMVRATAGV